MYALFSSFFLHTANCVDFRDDLRNQIHKAPYLSRVSLPNSEEREDIKNYVNPLIDKWVKLTNRIDIATGDLAVRRLMYFFQFQERLHVDRQLADLSLDVCCCMWHYRASIARYQEVREGYLERILKIENQYRECCQWIDKFQPLVIEAFAKWYPKFRFLDSLELYDYGLVELARGNIETAINLADQLIERVEGGDDEIDFLNGNQCLNLGITYAEAGKYAEAIDYLT